MTVTSKGKPAIAAAVNTSHVLLIPAHIGLYAGDFQDSAPKTSFTSNSASMYLDGDTAFKKVLETQNVSNLFNCPADTFYYDAAGSFTDVPKSFHDQPPDYLSYGFNGGNARTNSNAPGIAGRTLASIKNPVKTVLVTECPAFIPYSWHSPKLPAPNGTPMFNNALDMVSFVDGHASYLKIYWGGNNPPGALALHQNPPAGYDYQWSGD